MASSSGWMPTLRMEEAGSTGNTRPASTALRSPRTRSSWVSVPFSKNSSIRSSLVSATISTSFSRQAAAASWTSFGHVHGLELAALVVVVDVRLVRARGRPRPEALLLAEGHGQGHHASGRRPSAATPCARPKDARSRSMRLTTMRRGMLVLGGVAPDLLRLDLDPGHASTTTMAASATRSAERASERKFA